MRLRYSLHGLRFAIDADDAAAELILHTIMPPCARAGGRRSGKTAVFAVRCERGRLRVFRGRKPLWTVTSVAELQPWLESEVVGWLLHRFDPCVQLHAAVAEHCGRAVIIAGGPDSGKTSLACALALAGWSVMSDEVALLKPFSSIVASFPRAMLVKAGTVRRLPELRTIEPMRVALREGEVPVRYVSPAAFGHPPKSAARVRTVLFPNWSRTGALSPIGQREALERLLSASLNTARHPKVSLDTCVRLVSTVRLFRLQVRNLRESARLIAEALEAVT